MIQQALGLIQGELNKLEKAAKASTLDADGIDALNQFIRLLLAMKKDSRDSSIETDLEKLDQTELSDLAKQAMQFLKDK